MIKYAREDTHYLLHIYDLLRKDLVKEGTARSSANRGHLLKSVLVNSKKVCLEVFEKPKLKDVNYYLIITKNGAVLSEPQLKVLKAMLKWRDYIARL